MNRQRSRNRWRTRERVKRLDQLALKRIRKSFMLSWESWGGTRCPVCGTGIRPYMLIDFSGPIPGGRIDGCYADHPGECIERNWMI